MTAAESNERRAANLGGRGTLRHGRGQAVEEHVRGPAMGALLASKYVEKEVVAVEVVCEGTAGEDEFELLPEVHGGHRITGDRGDRQRASRKAGGRSALERTSASRTFLTRCERRGGGSRPQAQSAGGPVCDA